MDFKTKFAPNSDSLSIENGDVSFQSVVGSTSVLRWRTFIPPGTKTLQMTLFTYASPPESKVLMRFRSPPVGTAENVTPENAALIDIETVVQQLTANGGGVELPFSSPASSGGVKLSSRSRQLTQTILTQTGGWIYINALQTPGNRVFELVASVTVDEACYRSWYTHAQWDDSGNPVEGGSHTCESK